MRYPRASVKSGPTRFDALVSLGNRVIVAFTGSGIFISPAVTLALLSAAVQDVTDALAIWRPSSGRGSHASYLDLKSKALTLYNLLKAEAAYVQTTAGIAAGNDYVAMASLIGTSGFPIGDVPNPQGLLNPVVGFRKVNSTNLNPNQVKFLWDRPLDTRRGNVYLYRILRGPTTNIADAVEIATSSRTRFIDTNDTGSVQTYTYFIIAVNNEADGAASVAVTVTILG